MNDSPESGTLLPSIDSGSTPEERLMIALSNVVVTQFELIMDISADLAHTRGALLNFLQGNAEEAGRILMREANGKKSTRSMQRAFDSIKAWADFVNG